MYVSMYQYKCSIEHEFGNSTDQSERVYYLSYFIILYVLLFIIYDIIVNHLTTHVVLKFKF